ncbi:CAAX prenyl protease 1 homolog isoform X2 [Bacillus rossius redtenbacheri]|uniref:CAAX prenyl protease 1 homolog isoform X2 n=1 Tax=Bacillus rossius redtenbacheri TaxID=93214 RepID=UPI002FDE1B52
MASGRYDVKFNNLSTAICKLAHTSLSTNTQHLVYCKAVSVPAELRGIMDEETYQKARLYGLDKSSYSIVKQIFDILESTVFILLAGFTFFWRMSGDTLKGLGQASPGEFTQSLLFVFYMNLFNTVLGLPFSIYHTFVLEERHGFNKQTAAFFIKDKLKAFVVSQLIVLLLVLATLYIVKAGGDYFFIVLWLFTMFTTFFLLTIYPNYIAPLFDKYTPLPEGELRSKIEALAQSINFPLYKLYVVEGSKRSTHSNAYFYGFFKNKRIVLFDTLLKDYVPEGGSTSENQGKGCDNEEVLAVLAHELGHWQLNHILKNLVIMQLNLLLLFLMFSRLFKYPALYRAFGFVDVQPIIIGLLVILQFIFSPYNAVLSFLMTILSRRFEFQADAFAAKLNKAAYLRKALIKLNLDNLSFPVFDWLYSSWHHSHPPLLERLQALEERKDK